MAGVLKGTVKQAFLNGVLAIAIPFVLEALMIVAVVNFQVRLPEQPLVLSLAAAIIGLAFVARTFRPLYAVAASLLYVPGVMTAWIPFALGFNCGVYGNCL
jgi:hypothetical protein